AVPRYRHRQGTRVRRIHSSSICNRSSGCVKGNDRGGPMSLRNERELANTRMKLHQLEVLYEADDNETGGDEDLREAEMDSLKRLINQLREEIARYEVRQPTRR